MKTIVIYDQCGQEPISFFVIDRDISHLNGVYTNSVDNTDLQGELNAILFNDQDYAVELLQDFPHIPDAKVIVCGFLP